MIGANLTFGNFITSNLAVAVEVLAVAVTVDMLFGIERHPVGQEGKHLAVVLVRIQTIRADFLGMLNMLTGMGDCRAGLDGVAGLMGNCRGRGKEHDDCGQQELEAQLALVESFCINCSFLVEHLVKLAGVGAGKSAFDASILLADCGKVVEFYEGIEFQSF